MERFHVSIDCQINDGSLSSAVSLDDKHLVLNSIFDLSSVLPKTIHAVVCSAVSDALAKSFNELLSPKDESK